MGECSTARWFLQQHNQKYELQRNERTYIPNPDEGVGLWAVWQDVGGVYGAHASRDQLCNTDLKKCAYPKHSECCLLTLNCLLPNSSILVVCQ